MAKRFRLANISQGTTVDLLTGTLKLQARSWKTRGPAIMDSYAHTPYGANPAFGYFDVCREQFDLVACDTVSNIITATEDMEEIFEKARLFHKDSMHFASWWLEVNANGEAAKRSLIYKGTVQLSNKDGISPLIETDKILARVLIDRHPLWESTQKYADVELSMSWFGGTWQISNVPGTAPARMYEIQITGGVGAVDNVWIGIRPEYEGFSHWSPIWECEDGTNHPADTTDQADGTASSGNKVQVAFADPTLIKRMSIRVDNVTSYPIEYLGRYLVLCRCKVSAGTIGIQMKYGRGVPGHYSVAPNEEIYLTNTAWRLIPVGEVVIPPDGTLFDTQVGTSLTPKLTPTVEMQIWAERIDGAGTLDLDAFVLVPSDHFVGIYDSQSISALNPGFIFTTEADRYKAYTELLANLKYDAVRNPDIRDWYLPTGNSMVVIAGENSAGHSLTSTTNLALAYVTRWQTLRGS